MIMMTHNYTHDGIYSSYQIRICVLKIIVILRLLYVYIHSIVYGPNDGHAQ